MALAGAPRLILFDEPAAGLSPTERRELVALLRSLPPHMSFVLIEHDLDIALRVVERVTVMHNGRVLRTARRARSRTMRSAGDLMGVGTEMKWLDRERDEVAGGRREAARGPLLAVDKLDVYYGRAHALQGVALTIEHGVTAVVGRNGMGKTTLCNAITGLVRATGSVRLAGDEILGLAPHEITRRGIAYVPQGRRVWPSLTVDETLRLVAPRRRGRNGRRGLERVYTMFPRLAERRGHSGSQLSGGEQQMLAIGRALLLEPRLLVMDEPTEGLAPVVVQQVVQALRELGSERRDRGAADRAEPRRRDGGGRSHRRDGQWPHRARAVGAASWSPIAICRSVCSACTPTGTRSKATSATAKASRPPRPRRKSRCRC